MITLNRKAAVQFVIVLAAAAALKQFYSTASVYELKWILWPTARLTELLTGTQFSFEPFAGYMNTERSFLIASACAGVNFLIAAFLMLSLRALWNARSNGIKWRNFVFLSLAAYSITVVANTARISSALWLNASHQTVAGLDRDEVHRLDGILIYFGFLLLAFGVSERLSGNSNPGVKIYLFPLAVYYLMTLAVPITNGALKQGIEFWRHAAFVVTAPILLLTIVAIPVELLSRYSKLKNISTIGPPFPPDAPADEVCTRADVRDAAAFSHRTIWLKYRAVVGDR